MIELGIGLIELGIRLGVLSYLGKGLRIKNAGCTVLARVSGLVKLVMEDQLVSLRCLESA